MLPARERDVMSHDWILRFLQHRIADKPILRLIAKWLKVGISRLSQRNVGARNMCRDLSMIPAFVGKA
jgi:hypothetical protein